MLARHWRHLAKKEAKACTAAEKAGSERVPAAQTPEATFLPLLLTDFLQVKTNRHCCIIPFLIQNACLAAQ